MSNAYEKHNDQLCNCQGNSLPLNLRPKPYFLSIDRTFDKSPGSLRLSSGDFSSKVLSVDKKIPFSLSGSTNLFPSVLDAEGHYHFPNDENIITAFGPRNVAPILDSLSSQTWKDGNRLLPVAGRNCHCRSVWCPKCFCLLYRDKIRGTFAPFDWRKTRQVVLSVNPALFSGPAEAFEQIRGKRLVAEFVRRLRRGVKYKFGKKWLWIYPPIKIERWAWFLEWHKNGFPHYHVFLQVEKAGSAGMIGEMFIHSSWKLAKWIKESYFQSDSHFKALTGYYSDKGYFEKNKKHQGMLPDLILDKIKNKIRRYGSSEKKEGVKKAMGRNQVEEIDSLETASPFEENNFKNCVEYFNSVTDINDKAGLDNALIRMESDLQDLKANKSRSGVDYKAMLLNCETHVFIELDIRNFRFSAICKLDYKKWKEKPNGQFFHGKGYVINLSVDEIVELLRTTERVISVKEYMSAEDLKEYLRKRSNEIDRLTKYQMHVMHQG